MQSFGCLAAVAWPLVKATSNGVDVKTRYHGAEVEARANA